MKRTISLRGRQFVVDEEEIIHEHFWNEVEAGNWEPYTFEALERVLIPGDVFIDVGAWLGSVSLYAASLGAECHALEPDPVAFGMLCRNIGANPYLKIYPICMAVADHDGQLQMGTPDGLGSSMTGIHASAGLFECPCRSLSSFLGGTDRVDMVKLDVEGAESLVLADRQFFERFRPAVLVTLHPHLAPCDLDAIGDLYQSKEQVWPDVYLLTGRAA